MRIAREILGAAAAAVVIPTLAASPALGASYPLKKSADGRYLVDTRNVPTMIVGDSPQALMVNVSEAEADRYFADRQSFGFNTAWVNLLCTTYTGGRPDASTEDGVVPFTATLPGSDRYDLTTPNDAYFAHVDRILRLAASHGIQLLLDPIETGGFLPTLLDNGPDRARAYGQYLGHRYQGFDNILWMSGNDFQTWDAETNDEVVLAVAQGIQDNDARHLQTAELDFIDSSSLDDVRWTGVLGLNATYTYYPSYARLQRDYRRADFLPNFLVEANYEFEDLQGPVTTASILRKQEYWAMTSGATGQMYGNHYTWPFDPGWQAYLDTPGAFDMRTFVRFFASRPWQDLEPDDLRPIILSGRGEFASSGHVADNDYATAARTHDGRVVVIYTPVARTFTVDMSAMAGPSVARWYDPTRGTYRQVPGSPFPNAGTHDFTTPGPNGAGEDDWVLVFEVGRFTAPRVSRLGPAGSRK